MNMFEYRILDEVYDEIVKGNKTIEFRLLNEKSKSIKIGDNLLFKVVNNEEKNVLVEVTDKYIYDDLNVLWAHKEVLNNSLNYNKDEFINAFHKIFGKEKVNNSKIVGIKFKVKRI